MKRLLVFIVVLLTVSCNQTELISKENCPSCFKSIQKQSNPPLEIWRYVYNNQLVYLTKSDCCDQYDQLYDSNCTLLCAPSGGITGKGDGKCYDFNEKATHRLLVWKKD
jgi:hypothetical protein